MTHVFPDTVPNWDPDDLAQTRRNFQTHVDAAIQAHDVAAHAVARSQLEAIVAITAGYSRALLATLASDPPEDQTVRDERTLLAEHLTAIADAARAQLSRLAEFRPAVLD